MVTPSSPLTDLRCSRIHEDIRSASGLRRERDGCKWDVPCYCATEFENDVCVCTRRTGDLLTTKSACASRTSDCDRPAQR
eukprot:5425279-Prymnesium_polylepis.1